MTEQYTDLADLSPQELEEAKELGLIDDDPEPQEPTEEPDPAPVPPKEDEPGDPEENPEPPAEDPAPDDDKRTVPLKALHESREKRKKLQAELEDQRKRYLEAVEQNRQAAVKLAEFAERTAPKPEPEEEDPLNVVIRTEAQKLVDPILQRLQAQEQTKVIQGRCDFFEPQVKERFADYDEVVQPVFRELQEAQEAANKGNEQAAMWVRSILNSPNPPLAAYVHGQTRRMAQGTAPTSPAPVQSAPSAPSAPQTKTPPVLPRATGGGNGTGQGVTAERLLAMSTEDFDAWCTKHPKEARALMGG